MLVVISLFSILRLTISTRYEWPWIPQCQLVLCQLFQSHTPRTPYTNHDSLSRRLTSSHDGLSTQQFPLSHCYEANYTQRIDESIFFEIDEKIVHSGLSNYIIRFPDRFFGQYIIRRYRSSIHRFVRVTPSTCLYLIYWKILVSVAQFTISFTFAVTLR